MWTEGNQQWAFISSDNGVDFPEGVVLTTNTSLGLHLEHMLISSMKGGVELDCTQGTTFKITVEPQLAHVEEI